MVTNAPQDDYLYSPYVIIPRDNDLGKIAAKSGNDDTSQTNFDGTNNLQLGNTERFSFQKSAEIGTNGNDGYSDFGDYPKKDRYSIFDMSKSRYSDSEGNSRLSAS